MAAAPGVADNAPRMQRGQAMRGTWAASLAGAAMMCTAASPGWAQPTTAPFWDYRCPSPGTEVEGSDGNRTRYLGTAPEAPTLCLVEGLGPRLLGLPAAARDWESLKPVQ